jgi:predicted CopG family antitoxin
MVGSLAMPNQRAENIRRTTITVGKDLYAWAMAEAKRRGLNDFSTFIRSLIAAERKRVERKTNEKND